MTQECPSCNSPLLAGFKFCGNCGAKVESTEAPTSQAPSQPSNSPTQSQDERRDVTVLFGDVKGFTSMCEKLDPEEVHTVMNECFKGLGQIVQTEGGHIDKYIGDNIMALFGAPIAHEDDPARACRAALHMQDFLGTFADKYQSTTGVKLQMRIGIHCGLVIAGGIGAKETRKDYSVMGDTVNLASRLESLANPGSILVSEDIAKRARGRIKFSDKSLVSVKGKEESVYVREVISELSEIDIRGRDGFSADLIGREKEFNRLIEAWHKNTRDTSWIEIRGGLGFGKTRLVEEAKKSLGISSLLAVATPVTNRRPYGLARRLVQAVICSQVDENTIPNSEEELNTLLENINPSLNVYSSVLWFLTAPGPTSLPAPDPDPKTLRSLIETGISNLLISLANKEEKLNIVLDSFELVDAESSEILHALNQNDNDLKLQFIATLRNEAPVPKFAHTTIKLNPLDSSSVVLLVEKLISKKSVSRKLVEEISRLAGGNPLFIEELVRTITDESLENNNDALTLPASIRMAMVARLDRLSPSEREFLKRGAVQGTGFYHDILNKLDARICNEHPLEEFEIDKLYQTEILANDSICSRLRLCFKQPALQEAAYDTLLVKKRKELHRHTAEIIQDLAQQQESAAPELLGYHYEKAEAWGFAAKANLEEGRRASDLYLNEKSILCLGKSYESLNKLKEKNEQENHTLVQTYKELSEVNKRVGKYQEANEYALLMENSAVDLPDKIESIRLQASAIKHQGDLLKAKDLLTIAYKEYSPKIEAKEELFSVAIDLARISHRDSKNDEALHFIENAKLHLENSNKKGLIQLKILEGTIKHTQGKLEEAKRLYDAAYILTKEDKYLSELAKVINCLGNVERDLGNYSESQNLFEQALELWERTGNVHYIAGMHNNLGNIAMSLADYQKAKSHQESAFKAYQLAGNVFGSALACANLAMLDNEQGNFESGIAGATNALKILGEGGQWLKGLILGILGEAYLLASRIEDAKDIFLDISTNFSEKEHPLAFAGALRGLGQVKLFESNFIEAEKLLNEATIKYEDLQRTQESARSRTLKAKVLLKLEQKELAKAELLKALTSLKTIKAQGDILKIDQLLERIASGEI